MLGSLSANTPLIRPYFRVVKGISAFWEVRATELLKAISASGPGADEIELLYCWLGKAFIDYLTELHSLLNPCRTLPPGRAAAMSRS